MLTTVVDIYIKCMKQFKWFRVVMPYLTLVYSILASHLSEYPSLDGKGTMFQLSSDTTRQV